MSTKTKQASIYEDMDPHEIVAWFVNNAIVAKEHLPLIKVGQRDGRIVIVFPGWVKDAAGNVVEAG